MIYAVPGQQPIALNVPVKNLPIIILGGGVHSILRCRDTFQNKVAQLNSYTSEGGKRIHFLKGL